MNKNITSKSIAILLFVAFMVLLAVIGNYEKRPVDKPTDEPVTESHYYVKLRDGVVCFMKNNKTLKKYDIDITLLPGDDIRDLTFGIEVESEAEADLLAEDFDG